MLIASQTRLCDFYTSAKIDNFKMKHSDFPLIFCLKHRLSVHVIIEAVLTCTNNQYLSKNKKNDVHPCKPQLFILVSWDQSLFFCSLVNRAQSMSLFCFRFSMVLFDISGIFSCHKTGCICRIFFFATP